MTSRNPNWYEVESDDTPASRRGRPEPTPVVVTRRYRSLAFVLPLFLCLLMVAAVLVPLGLGIRDGEQDRAAFLQSSAENHYKRALEFEAENYMELAYTEVQIALRFDPNYAPARAKLLSLQSRLVPSGTPAPVNVADQLYKQAADAVQKQEWDDAIGQLEELRRSNPDYRMAEVDQMLFQAYVGGGKRAVASGNIELARQRFEYALALQPNDATALQGRDLARFYLAGQQAAGFDWGIAVSNYQKVYEQDPNYYDIKTQLRNALLSNAQMAAKQGAWCIAARDFDRAVQLGASTAADAAQAQTNCRNAVLTPSPTPTPTATPTPLGGSAAPPPAVIGGPGSYAAQVRRANDGQCSITGTVRDAANNPLPNIPVRYYNDFGLDPTPARTDAKGFYSFILGKDSSLFHVVVLQADGRTPASPVIDVDYAGGGQPECHIIVDWTRNP